MNISAKKAYSADQVQLFKKVLHGAPISWYGENPFSAVEFMDSLPLCEKLKKEDENFIGYFVLPSSIDHPQVGKGLYSRMENFCCLKIKFPLSDHHVQCVFVLGCEKNFIFFCHENRAILLKD